MKTRARGPDKPEQVTADIAYEILLELKAINAKLEASAPIPKVHGKAKTATEDGLKKR